MIQITCMMVMYLLWLDKPLGVDYLISVVGEVPASDEAPIPRELPVDNAKASRWKPRHFRDVVMLDSAIGWLMIFDEVLHYGVKPSHTVIARCLILAAYSAAWNAHSPTEVESILWKVSALLLPTTPLIHYLLDPHDNYYRIFEACWKSEGGWKVLSVPKPTNFIKRWREEKKRSFNKQTEDTTPRVYLDIVIVSILFSIYVCHVLTRGYLMMEAFISVRKLPVGACQTVSWGNYWPHL